MSKRNNKRKASAARQTQGTKSARVNNNVQRHSGIGTQYDYGEYNAPSAQPMSPFMQDKFAVDLYYADWAAKKIINIPVEDMLREGWNYEGLSDDQSAAMETLQDALSVPEKFKQAMRLERLIGGCAILMGIDDGALTPDQPVNHAVLRKGALKFLNVIPRTRIANTTLDNNPLSPTYGEPLTYWVNGVQIHRDRLILFKGDPLLQAPDSSIMPSQWMRNDGFGVSILTAIMDDLTRATGSRQAAYQLVQRASVFLFQADTMDLQGTTGGQAALQKMRDIVNQINLFRGAVVDRQPGDSDPITTISPSFGSVPELVMTFLQVLAAAADIPGSRFFSQAPGGLNAGDGGTSLENYYGGLAAKNKQETRPRLLKLLRVMGPSALGDEYSNTKIDVLFPPLWSLSEVEQSQVRTADATNILNMIVSGLLSDAEALEELRLRDVLMIEKNVAEEEDTGDMPAVSVDPAADLAASLAELQGAV